MAPLIAEYDRHMEQMTKKMEKYEVSKTLIFSFIEFESMKWDILQLKAGQYFDLVLRLLRAVLLFKFENQNLKMIFILFHFNQQMQMIAFKKKVEEVVMENER